MRRVLTARGEVRSEWRQENGKFVLDVTIPPNATAAVYILGENPAAVDESGRPAVQAEGVKFVRTEQGAAVFEIGSGRYSFAAPWPKPTKAAGPESVFPSRRPAEKKP